MGICFHYKHVAVTLTWLSEDATVIIGHVVQGDDLYILQRAMVMIEAFFFYSKYFSV